MVFDKIGLMLDCSRNAVPTVETLKLLINLLSKMGYNRLELYTEDTYEIKGRPYFGYMRGRYTEAELKEVDAYASINGVELVPCIQVLAHVNQIFKWTDVFESVHDCNDIMLVDEPDTYKLIDDMFATMAQNFTSRNINIGCDEAHMVGLGKFLDKNGYQDRFEIINRHIGKVLKIADKYGFKCSMWSDMYFRLVSGGDYYNIEKSIPQEILNRIPKNINLIYWDYYHIEPEHYQKMVAAHKLIGNEIEFAGGAWKWTGFTPENIFSMKCADAAVLAGRENGLKSMMVTSWGDNGAEASHFSVLPSLYYFAQLCKGESTQPEALEKGFKRITGVGFKDFLDIEEINNFPWHGEIRKPDASKYYLYNDCFLGLLDSHITGGEAKHYHAVVEKLKAKKYGKFSYLFTSALALAQVLEIKADIGVRTRKAYKDGDKENLKKIAQEYTLIIKRIAFFHKKFEEQWFKENKPFGFEVQDMRLGGLMQRIESCRQRLVAYCSDKIKNIPELEPGILPYMANSHLAIVTASLT